jgi:hypothetical protein
MSKKSVPVLIYIVTNFYILRMYSDLSTKMQGRISYKGRHLPSELWLSSDIWE